MTCSIAALLAAISLLTQPGSTMVLANITACDMNSSSAACYRDRARDAETRETEYRKVVTDAILACGDEEVFAKLFPNCVPLTAWAGYCRVMP
jgi:hypothetical protein